MIILCLFFSKGGHFAVGFPAQSVSGTPKGNDASWSLGRDVFDIMPILKNTFLDLQFFFKEKLNALGGKFTFSDENMLLEAKNSTTLDRMKSFVKEGIDKLKYDLITECMSMTEHEFKSCESSIKDLCEANAIKYVYKNELLHLYAFDNSIILPIKKEIQSNIQTWTSAAHRHISGDTARKKDTFASSVKLSGSGEYDSSKYRDTASAQTTNGGARPKHFPDYSVRGMSVGHSASPAHGEIFYTNKGIQIKVYKSDILETKVDCIVNAANADLHHAGGIAAVISKAAGRNLDEESKAFVKSYGRVRTGEVCSTTAGKLPFKRVVHAVGPEWKDYKTYSPVSKISLWYRYPFQCFIVIS